MDIPSFFHGRTMGNVRISQPGVDLYVGAGQKCLIVSEGSCLLVRSTVDVNDGQSITLLTMVTHAK